MNEKTGLALFIMIVVLISSIILISFGLIPPQTDKYPPQASVDIQEKSDNEFEATWISRSDNGGTIFVKVNGVTRAKIDELGGSTSVSYTKGDEISALYYVNKDNKTYIPIKNLE